jgi:hypothetical protein
MALLKAKVISADGYITGSLLANMNASPLLAKRASIKI